MPGSYEKINYSLRPAKAIERKMLCEAFRRLHPFSEVRDYRYIGFGSTYFSDFILFHKSLGIRNMISIERDVANKRRFKFNLPFNCIKMQFGQSTDVLPRLQWRDTRTILWLDYDDKLNANVLADVGFFCSLAPPGSVLVVTVNAHPDTPFNIPASEVGKLTEFRLDKLHERVGRAKVPMDIDAKCLRGWGEAVVNQQITNDEIEQILRERNGGLSSGSQLHYKQLFHFQYADGAKMVTTGGLLYDEGQSPLVASCNFGALPFIRCGSEPYRIEVPSLTYREIRHLETQLPCEDSSQLKAPDIPQADLEKYGKVYKYFPMFAETEI